MGTDGFPHGWAGVQKAILISKCLLLTGNNITVICKSGIHSIENYPNLKARGNFDGIEYIYTSGYPFRSTSFTRRNFLKLKGSINELALLRNRKRNKKLDFVILSTRSFRKIVFYSFLSKIYNFKIILNYVEFFSAVKKDKSQVISKLNDHLFDKFAPRFADSIFPISEFLISHLNETAPGKKYLKIPGLTDFDRYNNIGNLEVKNYFLFCGDAGYREIILFIIDAFNKLQSDAFELYLVINGSEENKNIVKKYIDESAKKNNIKVFSKLSEKDFFTFYKNADALLIPLRPTFQDIARFPHKTGEYMASGNPVISTNYGEIKYYFRDTEDILVSESYDVDLFADKMQFVIENPDLAQEIGQKGKNKARKLFDYRYKAPEINSFLDEQLK